MGEIKKGSQKRKEGRKKDIKKGRKEGRTYTGILKRGDKGSHLSKTYIF